MSAVGFVKGPPVQPPYPVGSLSVTTPSRPAPAPWMVPAALVALGTLGFGLLSSHNARAFAPCWGQDLAFFTQLVHRAASGGPWASPLLLEPQGFFEMVHTHLVLPLVAGTYALVPRQEVLLFFQAFFASLALWPAFRLGEQEAGWRGGLLAATGLAALGPFQAVAVADFRPSALFLPGVLGAYTASRQGRIPAVLGWALVANLGRQEGAWLALVVGVSLLTMPWGIARDQTAALRDRMRAAWRWRSGAALVGLGVAALVVWTLLKPQMFFHLNPLSPAPLPDLPDDIVQGRWRWVGRLVRSGGILGLAAPAPLVGALPLFREMARTGREWGPLVGPAAHYGAFWVPFVAAGGIAGAARLHRHWGLVAFAVLCATAFPWVEPRTGPATLARLTDAVEPDARVGASYDVIHRLAQREVIWNSAWLSMGEDDRPHGWTDAWPIPLDSLDVLVIEESDPLLSLAQQQGWVQVDAEDDHLLLRRP